MRPFVCEHEMKSKKSHSLEKSKRVLLDSSYGRTESDSADGHPVPRKKQVIKGPTCWVTGGNGNKLPELDSY